MIKLKSATKKLSIFVVLSVQLMAFAAFGFGNMALASETPAPTTEASVTYAPCPQTSGTASPTGSAAATYVFNPATCLWENAYYTWNPVTKATSPRYDQTPVLNTAGTAWEYVEWYFSPASGIYKQRTISIPVPQPAPQPTTGGQTPASNGGTQSNGSPYSPTGNGSQYVGSNSVSNTGPNSTNSTNGNSTNNIDYNLANNTSIFTTLNSFAGSGDALVMGNTTGGSATSGNAEAVANYLNMIQSAWNPSLGPISTFNAALQGSHFGDIMFNPDAVIKTTGPNSDNSINNNTDNNLSINSVDNSSITNDINIGAQSGNATVSGNTNGGDATTGDATAVANLINMINSRIAAGGSFIGNVNIYGDLDGDLLLPASVLAQLKNTGPSSTNVVDANRNTDIDIDIARNNTILNNVDLAAQSGNAIVDSNTNAGSAESGSATTSLKQADIVGKNISGKKGLLVFVNVLGKWTGMMWDGNALASLQDTGPNSSNQISQNSNTNIDANFVENNTITNNINLDSQSGDAVVSGNTNAGSATSGDASASANILNLIDSDVAFTDWFGVLFINVFGTWNGSFGVDTAAGETPTPPKTGGSGGGASGGSQGGNGTQQTPSGGSGSGGTATNNVKTSSSRFVSLASTVLGSGSDADSNSTTPTSQAKTSSTSTGNKPTDATVGTVGSMRNGGIDTSTVVWAAVVICCATALAALNRARLLGMIRPNN